MNNTSLIRITIAVAVITACLSGCQAGTIGGSQVKERIKTTLEQLRSTDDNPLTASGTIRADEIRIAAELGAKIVQIHVTKGDRVRTGELLVELDRAQLANRLAEAKAAVAAAEANLAVIKAGARKQEVAAAQAALSLAQAQQAGAYATWQNSLEAIHNPLELDAQIVEARAQVDLAEQQAFLAQAQLEREKLLRNQTPKDSTRRQVADLHLLAAEKALAAAQTDLETAQTMLRWLNLIRSRPLGLIVQANAAQSQYDLAGYGVAIAQARLDDLIAGATDQEIAVAERAIDLAQAQVKVIEAQLAKLAIASPVSGVVLDQTLRAGELAAPAAAILTLADLSQVTLTVYVPENRIGQIALSQEATVTVDSFPGRLFVGRVLRIGDQPEFTPRNIATKEERLNTFYAVDIALPNAEQLLKPGMPADAEF